MAYASQDSCLRKKFLFLAIEPPATTAVYIDSSQRAKNWSGLGRGGESKKKKKKKKKKTYPFPPVAEIKKKKKKNT